MHILHLRAKSLTELGLAPGAAIFMKALLLSLCVLLARVFVHDSYIWIPLVSTFAELCCFPLSTIGEIWSATKSDSTSVWISICPVVRINTIVRLSDSTMSESIRFTMWQPGVFVCCLCVLLYASSWLCHMLYMHLGDSGNLFCVVLGSCWYCALLRLQHVRTSTVCAQT